jgi:hypothetical protein
MKSFLYLAVSNDLFYVSGLVTLLPHVSYVCKFITAMDDIDLSTSSEISFMFGFFFAVSHLFCFEIRLRTEDHCSDRDLNPGSSP